MGVRKQAARLRQTTLERLHTALVERERRLFQGNAVYAARDPVREPRGTSDEIEMAADLSDREILCTVAEHHCEELAGIEDAFRKMRDGTYGICEECDARIRAARLRALPYARLCVRCQEAREREVEIEDGSACWATVAPAAGDDAHSNGFSVRTSARR